MAGNITKRYEADYAREVHSVDADERSYYGTGTYYIPSAEEHGLPTFGGVHSGQIIGDIPGPGEKLDDWQMLARGCSPDGEKLTRNAGADGRVAAFDFTFTAPKGLSALWAAARVAESDLSSEIDVAMDAASKTSLQLLQERAAFGITRDKGGVTHRVPLNIIAGMFNHETSRADDPHKHSHNLILNVGQVRDMDARRELIGAAKDKKLSQYLCLESKYLMQWQNAAASIGQVELAWRMKEIGISLKNGDFTFDVDHIPPALTDLWSKRTAQVEMHATAYAIGMRQGMPEDVRREYLAAARAIADGNNMPELSGEVAAAAISFKEELDLEYAGSVDAYFEQNRDIWRTATLDTRADKSAITNSELYARWSREIEGLGYTADQIIDATLAARYEAAQPFDRQAAMNQAETNSMQGSWVSEAQVYRHAFDAVTGHMSVDDAKLFAEEFIQERLIKIGYDPVKETALYTTPEMLKIEESLLNTVVHAKHAALDEAVVNRVMGDAEKGAHPMTEEQQRAAMSVMTGGHAVSVIEGTAGAGKSFTLKTVVETYKQSGYDVHATALTWQAADVLKSSTGMDRSAALAGFLQGLERGDLKLTEKSLVVVDEAGLVGSRQMQALAAHVERAGAKMILSGDSKQLSPVEGASILKTVVREIGKERSGDGYARIDFIYRQKNNDHRQAVYDFMAGKAGDGLKTYVENGNVKIIDGGNAATVKSAVESAWSYAEKCKADGRLPKQLILAVDNKSVRESNLAFQQKRIAAGELDSSNAVNLQGAAGAISVMVGEQIQFRTNDKKDNFGNRRFTNRDRGEVIGIEQGVKPGDPATLTIKMDNRTLKVKTNDEALRDQKSGKFGVDLAYSISVYSSQGMTVDRVDMVATEKYSRELAYVAASRHTHELEMHVDKRALAEQFNASRREDEQKPLDKITNAEIIGQMASTWSRDNDPGSAIEMKRLNERMSQDEIRKMKEKEMVETRLNMREQRETAAEAMSNIEPEKPRRAALANSKETLKRVSERVAKSDAAAQRVIAQAQQRAAEMERQEEKRRQEQAAKRGAKL